MTIAPESIPKVATSPRGLRHLFAMLSASRVSSVGRRERDVLMHALFATAAELAHHADEDAVLAHICRAVVDASSRIKLAWIWTGAPDAREVQPRIYAGPAAEYARRLVIERNWVTQRRQVFRAMQASAHDNARVFRPSPYAPRRGSKAEFGFDSALALPIRLADPARRAVLVVYADDAHYFPQVGRAPFIAFAHLAEVALEQVRRSAETRAIVERDPLTGLPDQRGAETHFAQAWRGLHEHQTFSLLMIDMDQFEHVNKRLGRASGDRVLRDTGLAITAALRAQDKLARWN
ncbi:MAG TPA: diguanylate cyclase, partial [Burkholderiaceae bacterium]|nr:diguanylate cyclase [Burkholderiaceae bacterium]